MSKDKKSSDIKKPFYKKWWFWIIVVIIVIGGGASSSNQATKVGTNNGTSSSKSSEQTVFKVGDIISYDKKEITVTSVERNHSSGNEYIKPSDGMEYVKVTIKIENKSDDKISYNTLDWEMQDSNGDIKNYLGAAMAQASDNLGSGDLAKNGTKTGSIVFEVPSGDSKLTLHYKSSFWSDKTVEIELQ